MTVLAVHAKEKIEVDKAVQDIANTPAIGDQKKGGRAGIFVHKFKMNKQEALLSYRLKPDKHSPQSLVLLSLGSHENFYADLKRQK